MVKVNDVYVKHQDHSFPSLHVAEAEGLQALQVEWTSSGLSTILVSRRTASWPCSFFIA